MPDRIRSEPELVPESLPPAERENRIEQLLLTGLDQYFAGEYERAVSTWTRVLFLDRGHARAKAYIDRARGAIAERQRESDELLHKGVAAFNRGETESARRLLTSVIERGGPQEVALAFLDRLARLERPGHAHESRAEAHPAARRKRPIVVAKGRRWQTWLLPVSVLAAIVAGFLYVEQSRERSAPFLFLADRAAVAADASRVGQDVVPVPRPAEIDLARARRLMESGHARDALRLVQNIRGDDPLRPDADRLRAEIQRVLLALPDGAFTTPLSMPSTVPAVREQ